MRTRDGSFADDETIFLRARERRDVEKSMIEMARQK